MPWPRQQERCLRSEHQFRDSSIEKLRPRRSAIKVGWVFRKVNRIREWLGL
jgi:hypothetical protein